MIKTIWKLLMNDKNKLVAILVIITTLLTIPAKELFVLDFTMPFVEMMIPIGFVTIFGFVMIWFRDIFVELSPEGDNIVTKWAWWIFGWCLLLSPLVGYYLNLHL